MLNAVTDASDAKFIGALGAFIDHTGHHFAEESARADMADLPPCHCHHGEHDSVLTLYCEVRKRTTAGEMELGRRLVAKLPVQFTQRVGVMNRMMATYLTQMDNAIRTMEHVG